MTTTHEDLLDTDQGIPAGVTTVERHQAFDEHYAFVVTFDNGDVEVIKPGDWFHVNDDGTVELGGKNYGSPEPQPEPESEPESEPETNEDDASDKPGAPDYDLPEGIEASGSGWYAVDIGGDEPLKARGIDEAIDALNAHRQNQVGADEES